jgi:hypothetical protein
LLVFFCGACSGSHHVAEIAWRKAGHHGVQIDDANAFTRRVIEHHIVELGVVVSDAFGKIRVLQNAHDRFMAECKVDLRIGECCAVRSVARNRGKQRFESFWRVVKIGNGVMQSRGWHAGKQILKTSESPCCLECLFSIFNCVIGAGAGNVVVGAPVVAFFVHVPCGSAAVRNQAQCATIRVWLVCHLCA